MNRQSHKHFEVLVVGAGPAGIAAAVRAAECGRVVGLVDDNPYPGGQVWRGAYTARIPTSAASWFHRLKNPQVELLCARRVFDGPEPGVLLAESETRVEVLHYGEVILATGARERLLPFPGWTLPNVIGAGGLQALVKSGLTVRGKRVVVAGTGPLLLAVAAFLREHGAEVPIICEQASWKRLTLFATRLVAQPRKLEQALRLKRSLRGADFSPDSWVSRAEGTTSVERATVVRAGRAVDISCDFIACGFHLTPNIELPRLLNCRIENGFVAVDEFQRTAQPNTFCAGEPTGIGGVELSIVEGEIAGLAAAGELDEARCLFSTRRKARVFADLLERTFQLRPQLKGLATADTLVCRCEDIAHSQLRDHHSWRSAKLFTRCGMGRCQGRICGTATEILFGWSDAGQRPPIFPVRVESLTAGDQIDDQERAASTA